MAFPSLHKASSDNDISRSLVSSSSINLQKQPLPYEVFIHCLSFLSQEESELFSEGCLFYHAVWKGRVTRIFLHSVKEAYLTNCAWSEFSHLREIRCHRLSLVNTSFVLKSLDPSRITFLGFSEIEFTTHEEEKKFCKDLVRFFSLQEVEFKASKSLTGLFFSFLPRSVRSMRLFDCESGSRLQKIPASLTHLHICQHNALQTINQHVIDSLRHLRIEPSLAQPVTETNSMKLYSGVELTAYIIHEQIDRLLRLSERGMNLESKLGKISLLCAAAQNNKPKVIQFLLQQHVRTQSHPTLDSEASPLFYAIESNSEVGVRLLLDAGSNPIHCNSLGDCSLSLALRTARSALVAEILSRGNLQFPFLLSSWLKFNRAAEDIAKGSHANMTPMQKWVQSFELSVSTLMLNDYLIDCEKIYLETTNQIIVTLRRTLVSYCKFSHQIHLRNAKIVNEWKANGIKKKDPLQSFNSLAENLLTLFDAQRIHINAIWNNRFNIFFEPLAKLFLLRRPLNCDPEWIEKQLHQLHESYDFFRDCYICFRHFSHCHAALFFHQMQETHLIMQIESSTSLEAKLLEDWKALEVTWLLFNRD